MDHAITISDVLIVSGGLLGVVFICGILIAVLWAIAQGFKD